MQQRLYMGDGQWPVAITAARMQIGRPVYIKARLNLPIATLAVNKEAIIKTANEYCSGGIITNHTLRTQHAGYINTIIIQSRCITLKNKFIESHQLIKCNAAKTYIYALLLDSGYKPQAIKLNINNNYIKRDIIHYCQQDCWSFFNKILRDNCLTFICAHIGMCETITIQRIDSKTNKHFLLNINPQQLNQADSCYYIESRASNVHSKIEVFSFESNNFDTKKIQHSLMPSPCSNGTLELITEKDHMETELQLAIQNNSSSAYNFRCQITNITHAAIGYTINIKKSEKKAKKKFQTAL